LIRKLSMKKKPKIPEEMLVIANKYALTKKVTSTIRNTRRTRS
jgi:hypothetical protein